jgi:hypothetical protein
MEYKVIPFNAVVRENNGAVLAAKQLQQLIDEMKADGWEYVEMVNIDTFVQGNDGCLGIGSTPSYNVSVAAVVFRR